MMKNKSIFAILLLLNLLLGVWSTIIYAQTAANFIFINYIGQELILTLDDVIYTVPGTDTQPQGGQLSLTLPVGVHKFAANVPGGPPGFAGEFTLEASSTVAKAARFDQSGPIVDAKGLLVEPPRDFVLVFDADLQASPLEEIPVLDTWQPAAATPMMGSLVWVNHIGDELTLDLNGTLYKVLPKANELPGRLQIDVAPGDYRYTASVPAGSLNGELTMISGEVIALNIMADPPEAPTYKVGEKFEFIQALKMKLFSENLSDQVNSVAEPTKIDSVPLTLPNTGADVNPLIVEPPAVTDVLVIKNYGGDTLVFTINNQTYTIPNNAVQTLYLPPGHYTYTASIPAVATNGLVDLSAGRGRLELSIAINVAHDFLNVYQN